MPAYATEADFAAYVEGWTTSNTQALARLLERASRDVDAILGPLPIRRTGTFAGFKLDPGTLNVLEAAALARATCAQAEHRFRQGDKILDRPVTAASGPDFSATYADQPASNRYAPNLAAELEPIRHLYGVRFARARG